MKKQLKITSLLILMALCFSCQTESPTDDELDGVKKLSYYTEFFYDPTFGFQPISKVRYEYNSSGKLIKYFVYRFDANKSLIEQHHYNFTYSNNRVDKITGFFTGEKNPFVLYSYEYSPESQVTKIKEENYQVGISSEVRFNYDLLSNSVTALYTFSNGGSFTYSYKLVDNNITSDKTTKESEICNTGEYAYDNGINPFSQLGYIEYTLNNVSVNNKLVESVDYLNCSFPSLVPESYSHVYDNLGYPIESTTYYVNGGKSKKMFIYK